jgi:hypothetical protein
MSRFYLENEIPQRAAGDSEADLRARMAEMVKGTSFAGKLNPATAPLEVLRTLERPITEAFAERAAAEGRLVCEEFTDAQGRTCRRYHGSSKAGLEPFREEGRTVFLERPVVFDGKVYARSRIPNHIRAAMAIRSMGAEN